MTIWQMTIVKNHKNKIKVSWEELLTCNSYSLLYLFIIKYILLLCIFLILLLPPTPYLSFPLFLYLHIVRYTLLVLQPTSVLIQIPYSWNEMLKHSSPPSTPASFLYSVLCLSCPHNARVWFRTAQFGPIYYIYRCSYSTRLGYSVLMLFNSLRSRGKFTIYYKNDYVYKY